MYNDQQTGSDDHDGRPFSFFIVNTPEERRQQNIPERQQHGDQTGEIFFHPKFIDHQVSGIFQEREYSRVEKYTQNGNVPPSLVTQYLSDIRQLEFILRIFLFLHSGGF